jgi:putative transposase
VRLRTYDYSAAGIYFVTICTYGKRCTLGRVVEDVVHLSRAGKVVEECWRALRQRFARAELDEFVVMPNHLHGLIILQSGGTGTASAVPLRHQDILTPERSFGQPKAGELPTIIRSLKSKATRRINDLRGTVGAAMWQRGYDEHVVRNVEELEHLRRYILENPLKWALDRENPRFGK